jgi:alkylation response protein AidB-like acyl-CoA dehydrogenase
MTAAAGCAMKWLIPLLPSIAELTELDARRLNRFEEELLGLLVQHPTGPGIRPQIRSRRLARIRRELAGKGYLAWAVPAVDGGYGGPVLVQTLIQFICGYHDTDLRDSAGLGHGRLIARHATPPIRDLWVPRLLGGAVAGIAITESHGGSQIHATKTAATAQPDGTWTLRGAKTHISRLREADVFIVFFMDPAQRLTAAVIDAAAAGIRRRPATPAGLSGWSWGSLRLQDVRLTPASVLARPGDGMDLLHEHFAHYRPLVAATALGGAAAVHDLVADHLCTRRKTDVIADLRDNALIALGRAYAQINTALLGTLTAQQLSDSGSQLAGVWGCSIKAHAADVAHAITSDLAPLAGAAEFTATSRLVKIERDLRALLYADGIHDSLFRAAGRALTGIEPLRPIQPRDRSQATPPPRSPQRPGMQRSGGLPAA